jgi:predicted O-linked N-acetylglucosamine transferase (SPINDLY family)
VKIAVSLANDLPSLASIRASLREKMALSPLCDARRFAANFSSLMREVWRSWLATLERTAVPTN